jgi:hypothetical protein
LIKPCNENTNKQLHGTRNNVKFVSGNPIEHTVCTTC